MLKRHWPEYGMEAFGLGLFMISACAFTVLLQHPDSPIPRIIPDEFPRRALMGAAMGLTAIANVYSPWGKRSGAHLNPSFTIAFLRLGKVKPTDAGFYVLAHFVGAIAGVSIASIAIGQLVSHPSVNYAVTAPGPRGTGVAFVSEVVISFILMLTVLFATNAEKVARHTGLFAGLLVATYITLESPLSGMSMNPARTLGSGWSAGMFTALWIYFTAPPLGMLLAAQVYLRLKGARNVRCAKLHHQNRMRCIFCGDPGGRATASRTPIEVGDRLFQTSTQTKGEPEMIHSYRTGSARMALLASLAVVALIGVNVLANDHAHTSKPFAGAKANTGTVTHTKADMNSVLTLSNDFVVPDTPAPHWQVVDSKGNVYLLHRLVIKENRYNKSITVPPYVEDIAKVQIWCAWAETLLGEALFDSPVK